MNSQRPENRQAALNYGQRAQQILSGVPVRADYDALYQTALNAINNRGWSVVPVWGDLRSGQQMKAVALASWTEYQHRYATPDELREWFIDGGKPGLAVVCGDLSGLVVLDCDTPEIAADFAAKLPDLTETYTVLSANKGLPHYYFRPPAGASLTFLGRRGLLELRGNGHIVVTYPTAMNGKPYQLKRGGEPLALTMEQFQRLVAFIEHRTGVHSVETQPDHSLALVNTSQGLHQRLIDLFYKTTREQNSRNVGLFYTAMAARDSGWEQSAVLATLRDPFVKHAPITEHLPETSAQRAVEGALTVKSAYGRASCTATHHRNDLQPLQLPTSAREYLCGNGSINAARLLDALYMFGCQPDQIISHADIVAIGKLYHIGNKTVIAVLRDACNDTAALRLARVPEPDGGSSGADTHSMAVANATVMPVSEVESNLVSILHSNRVGLTNCVSQDANSPRNRKGRKSTIYYHIPAPAELCLKWGIEAIGSGLLTPADLRSSKAYRQAITEELIKRRPGQYSKRLLSSRVGVKSTRTIDTYTKDNPAVIVSGQVGRRPLRFSNLGALDELTKAELWGRWLEDEVGKKYPPFRGIAEKHLKAGENLWLCQQLCNRYDHVDNLPVVLEKSA
ncbi:MAG: bifunctional DNA primase/polymerase [Anaerolineae bacterium]|nr:bifunctional DNA primase/polymerase [Anaerolineae bacterium]